MKEKAISGLVMFVAVFAAMYAFDKYQNKQTAKAIASATDVVTEAE